jgi:hypothetical protein
VWYCTLDCKRGVKQLRGVRGYGTEQASTSVNDAVMYCKLLNNATTCVSLYDVNNLWIRGTRINYHANESVCGVLGIRGYTL